MHAFFNVSFLTQSHLIIVPLRSKSNVVIWILSSRIYAYHLPSTFQETTNHAVAAGKKKKLQHLTETDGSEKCKSYGTTPKDDAGTKKKLHK
jgi:hypothetical protein